MAPPFTVNFQTFQTVRFLFFSSHFFPVLDEKKNEHDVIMLMS